MQLNKIKIRDIQRKIGVKVDGWLGPITLDGIHHYMFNDEKRKDGMDKRSLKNIDTLQPKIQRQMYDFVLEAKQIAKEFGVEYVAISGNRTYAEQRALYNKGRDRKGKIINKSKVVTNARPGYSRHNFGLALDFGVFRDGDYLDSSEPKLSAKVHKKVAETLADKYNLQWGGNWKTFKDYPHFEYDNGLSLAEMRRRVKNNQPLV